MTPIISHKLGVTLTQKTMSEKTHELSVTREVLQAFAVLGCDDFLSDIKVFQYISK